MSLFCFTQETITAQSETLTTVAFGKDKNQVMYNEAGNDIFSLLGISVINEERLFIPASYFNSKNQNRLYLYDKNGWKEVDDISFPVSTFYQPYSQNGYIITSKIEFFANNQFREINVNDYCEYERDFTHYCYFVPKGIIIEKQHYKIARRQITALEIVNNQIVRSLDDIDEINEWLKTQKGNFSVDEEKRLLKDGFIYSCYTDEEVGMYNGKLKSGHNLFIHESKGVDITNSNGLIELHMDFSWAKEGSTEKLPYSYGSGNYGEIYCFINAIKDKNGKLSVVRNHLKYFGILNDDKIRLRKGPGTNTESLGTYPIKTGFRILEKSGVKQTIGGVTDEWIKVRLLDGTEGYFFGQYVQNLYDGPGTPLPWPNVAD